MPSNQVQSHTINESRHLWDNLSILLFAIAIILLFWGIGWRAPWPADEPRFAEVAREMVATGHWFFPMRGGELYPDKPPVFMWSIAFFYWITGNLKVSFLLPNALCGLLTLVLVWDVARRLWNVKTARTALFLLLLAPQFLIQAKNAQIDAMVACWITLSCYCLIRHFFISPNWRLYFLAWAVMGLGVITKGVGFLPMFMLIPIAVYAFPQRHALSGAFAKKAWFGPLVMLAIIAAWLIPLLILTGTSDDPQFQAYRDNILFRQTAERYANSLGHLQPWHYYISSVIPAFWFPLPFMIIAFWKPLRESWKQYPIVWVLLSWVVLVVIFFSISPGKRGVYVLPALPMLALALSPAVNLLDNKRWLHWLIMGVLTLIGVVLFIGGIAGIAGLEKAVRELEEQTLQAGVMLCITGGIWLATLWYRRDRNAYLTMGSLLAVTWLIFASWGYHLLDPNRTPKAMMAEIAHSVGHDSELGLVNFKEQHILFSPQTVTHFSYLAPIAEQEQRAWKWLHEAPDRFILIPDSAEVSCFIMSKGRDMGLAHRRHWILFDPSSAEPDCEPPKSMRKFVTQRPYPW
ncbi:glycosyltransferase family 39 protein [Photobacterium sp. SP02]|uniref:ArnT family glycosyltransferase n=1 Tax=Photobacterium sp. SP02 TaxID=3032280 RepID=UPI0031456DF1